MSRLMRSNAAALVTMTIAVLLVFLGGSALNAEKPTIDPAAAKILDRYVAAIGGTAVYDKAMNSVSKGTLDIPAAGVQLDVTVYSARPNKVRSIAESPAVGAFDRGTDGKIFWDTSTMQGARLLEGEELAEAMREAAFEGLVYWRAQYDSVATAGVDTVDGSPCDEVVMKADGGKPRTLSFDRSSGLLVKSSSIVTTQMGDIPVDAYIGDYRKVGDMLSSFKSTIKVMGQDRIMTLSSIEYNVAIPDTMFTPPADVQKLLQK
jgi:hypothetical protein